MVSYPNLYSLKYFADAVELGGISASARKNLVTHPAVSRAIAALEEQLGVALLEHRKKVFKVTPDGYRIADQARALLTAASGFSSLSLDPEHSAGTLAIGLSRTLAASFLEPILRDLRLRFPAATTSIRFGTTSDILAATADHAIDLGLTIGTQPLPTLRQTALRAGRFVLVEAADSPRTDLTAKAFLLTEPRYETELLRKGYQRHFGSALPVLAEIRSWEAIALLVRQGLGVGLLPDIALRGWPKKTYRILSPNWFECAYEIHAHHHPVSAQNPLLRHVLELLSGRLLTTPAGSSRRNRGKMR